MALGFLSQGMPTIASLARPQGMFGDMRQPKGMLDGFDMSGLTGRQSWEGLPDSVLLPILRANRQPWSMPWLHQGAGPTGAGTIGADQNNVSQPATAQNIGNAITGMMTMGNPIGLAMLGYNALNGNRTLAERGIQALMGLLGLGEGNAAASNTQTGINIGMQMGQLAPDVAQAVADAIAAASVDPGQPGGVGEG